MVWRVSAGTIVKPMNWQTIIAYALDVGDHQQRRGMMPVLVTYQVRLVPVVDME